MSLWPAKLIQLLKTWQAPSGADCGKHSCTNNGNIQFFHISFFYKNIIYLCKEGVKFEVRPVQTKSCLWCGSCGGSWASPGGTKCFQKPGKSRGEWLECLWRERTRSPCFWCWTLECLLNLPVGGVGPAGGAAHVFYLSQSLVRCQEFSVENHLPGEIHGKLTQQGVLNGGVFRVAEHTSRCVH